MTCPECGNDDVAEGLPLCLDCMEAEESRNASSALEDAVLCICERPIVEFLWVVRHVWYCSMECAYPHAYRAGAQPGSYVPQTYARLADPETPVAPAC